MKRKRKVTCSLFLILVLILGLAAKAERAGAADILVVAVGETKQLSYQYSGGYDYVWMTNDTDIIRISGSGSTCRVTGLNPGTAYVKVQVMYDVTRFFWTSPTKSEPVTTTQYAQQSFMIRVTKDGTLITPTEGTKGETVDMSEADKVYSISEGLILVKKDDLFGYVDRDFNLVIPFQYDKALSFEGGLAFVRKNDISYIIDPSGKTIFSGRGHTGISNNGDGTILVFDYNNSKQARLYGLYDSTGKKILDIAYQRIDKMSEGLRYIRQNDSKHGFVDETGKYVIRFGKETEYAYEFEEGLSKVYRYDEYGNWQEGFIDHTGRTVFTYPGEEWESYGFREGLSMTENEESRICYMNREGTLVIPFDYYRYQKGIPYIGADHVATDFEDGMAVVLTRISEAPNLSYRYGVIDNTGKTIIPFDYTDIWYLGEDLFAYQLEDDGQYGILHKDGTVISDCIYESSSTRFYEGIAMMDTGNGWCGIDTSGKQIIPADYTCLDKSFDGHILGAIDGDWVCIPNPLMKK